MTNGTTCSDTTHFADFAVGDKIAVQMVRSGSSTAAWSSTLTYSLGGGTLVTGEAKFASLSANCPLTTATNPGSCDTTVAAPQTVKTFNMTVGTPTPAAVTAIATLFRNGVATAITCTIPASSSACNPTDTTHEVVLIAGDVLAVQLTRTGTTAWTTTIATISLGSNNVVTVSNPHIVMDTVAMVGGTATVTFPGATAFTTPPVCTGNDQTSNSAVQITTTASTVTFTGTTTHSISYICIGN